MGVALSIIAFPVLARILAGLKLLTTRVGEIAMAVVAFNDVVVWILLTALSFVAFCFLDHVNFLLCFVFKAVDLWVEAEFRPCY